MVSEINATEITFETDDFKMTAGFDYEFDDDTANLELMFDGIQLDNDVIEPILNILKAGFSNQTDAFYDYNEEGEDSVYTTECSKTMLNNTLINFAPALYRFWTGTMTIVSK
jgi:hypothetical protein